MATVNGLSGAEDSPPAHSVIKKAHAVRDLCPLCHDILKHPTTCTTSCCGTRSCQSCFDGALARDSVCPLCIKSRQGESNAGDMLDFHCKFRSEGCQWVGKMERYELHLENDCGFVEVECDFSSVGCLVRLPRKDLQRHKEGCVHEHLVMATTANETMRHLEDKFEKKFEEFWRELERKDNHLAAVESSLLERKREIDEMRGLLKLKDRDIEDLRGEVQEIKAVVRSMEEQLQHKSKQLWKISNQLQAKDKQFTTIQETLAEKDVQIGQLLEEVAKLKSNLEKQKEQHSHDSVEFYDTNSPPFVFTMNKFSHHQLNGTPWESPPFYSHPRGYKLCARIYANHQLLGEGTHVSLYLYILSGEFDGDLQWPRKLTITAQLLNQATREWGCKSVHSNTWENPLVFDQGGSGWGKFIAHSDLISGEDVQYLKDDCIRFKIASVRMEN